MKNLATIFLLIFFCVSARVGAGGDDPSVTGTGRDAALSHFILALQLANSGESPEAVADSLIASINSDRKNAMLPATYLLRIANAPGVGEKAYKTLSELVTEYPESFFYRYAAFAAGFVAGVESRELDRLFPPLEKLQAPCRSVDDEIYQKKLIFVYAENLLNIPDFPKFKELVAAFGEDIFFLINPRWQKLICRGLNREYLSGLAEGKDVEHVLGELQTAAALLIMIENEISVERTVAVFNYLESLEVINPEFLDIFEKILPPEVFRELQLDYISKFGSEEDIAAAIKLPYPGKTPAKDAVYLFYNAIAKENLTKAKEIAATFPDDKLRPVFQNIYDVAAGNFDFENLSNSGAAQDKATLYAWLNKCKTPEQVHSVTGIADKSFWSDPEFANAVGYTLAMVGGDLEEAEKLLEYSLKCRPDNSNYLDSMAMILFKKGKLSEAQQMMQSAIRKLESRSSYKTLLDHAGDIELALGNREMALTYYRRALKCFSRKAPNFAETEQIRRKIEKLESAGNGK